MWVQSLADQKSRDILGRLNDPLPPFRTYLKDHRYVCFVLRFVIMDTGFIILVQYFDLSKPSLAFLFGGSFVCTGEEAKQNITLGASKRIEN